MKRFISRLIVLASLILMAVSCQKAPFITMNGPRSFTFTRDGGSQSFTFTCNRDWSVSSTESWVTLTPSSGTATDGDITVKINCAPNTTYDARSATVTVKLDELSETITITQDTGLGLIVSPTTFDLTNAAQDIEIEVQKNIQYSIAIDEAGVDWIKPGGTKSLTTDRITFHIAQNTDYSGREGRITFKQTDGSLSETVVIRQDQTNGLFVTTPTYDLSNEAHTLTVEVKANVEFEVASQADWIKFIETKALKSSTVVLTIDANESYDNRTGTVLVKQTNGELTGTITINQKQTDGLFVTPTSFELTNEQQTIELSVKKNVEYDIVIPGDARTWVSVQGRNQTKALTDETVTLAIKQNTNYGDRETSVTLKQTNGALAETVVIHQSQTNGLFITTPKYDLSNDGHTLSVEVKANVEFEVTPQADWIKFVETKALKASTIVLTIDANESYDNRTGTVLVKQTNGELTGTITINQKQTDGLIVTPNSFELTNQEQNIEMTVTQNVAYSIVIPDEAKSWVSIPTKAQTKALVDDKVILFVAANTTYDDRETSITIKQNDGPLAETVKIKQFFGEGLIVDKKTYKLDRAAGTVEVAVKSNAEYEVTTEAPWVHYIQTKALTSSTVELSIDENDSYTTREAVVTIKLKSGTQSSNISIKQTPFGFVEFEGYTYKTIKYGEREWFAENLRAKFGYEEGERINENGDRYWPNVGSPWADINGELVYAMDDICVFILKKDKRVCPEGWHISTTEDWNALFSLSTSTASAPFIKKSLGGTDDFSFGGNYGRWHTATFWLEKMLSTLFEDNAVLSSSEGAFVESRSANQRHFPAENYRHIRCVRGPVAPIIQTLPVIKQTTTSAEVRFEVLNNPNAKLFPYENDCPNSAITKVVFKYGTSKDNLSSSIESPDSQSAVSITGLTPGTKYYYQPIVEYEGGNSPVIGEIMSFKTYYSTLNYQGVTYYTTLLGNIEFMAQNLRSTNLNDGTPIPLIPSISDWLEANGPGQCIAYNKEEFLEPLGRLYNGYAIQTGKICPEGWRLPKNSELINKNNGDLHGDSMETGSIFIADTRFWSGPVLCNNDLSLSLLPSGMRYGDSWSATQFEEGFSGEHWKVYIWSYDDKNSNSLNAIEGALQMGSQGYVMPYLLNSTEPGNPGMNKE